MPITNCLKCGYLYEERSEERANEPTRECMTCWRLTRINEVLDEIEEYLEQRADADGVPSGGGYIPNEEMTLLVKLGEVRRRIASTQERASE